MTYRIMYIEDELILGRLVCETLQKQGYEVKQITNGADAFYEYKQFAPHLCLLDVMLPCKDGFEIAAQIRALDTHIPILFLTAKVQAADVVAGFQAGCNDYIRKPFSIDELLVRVKNWIDEKYGTATTAQAAEYRIGEDIFNPHKQTLQTGNVCIRLTYKEALLLEQLYLHRNSFVQRAHLLQQVWGQDTMYHSRSLDVYINRLRKYFRHTPYQIITLKGIGYRFVCQ